MKRNSRFPVRLTLIVAAVLVAALVGRWVLAQAKHTPIHLTTDWSNRHMVYSQPANVIQAFRLNNDARFGHQWVRQNAASLSGAAIAREGGLEAILQQRGGHGPGGPGDPIAPKKTAPAPQSLRSDWGMSLQASASTGAEMFPAKFDFDVTTAPDCTNDFVVFNSGLPSAAPVDATETATFQATSPPNSTFGTPQTFTITYGDNSITWYANSGTLTSASATIAVSSTSNLSGVTVTVGNVTYTYATSLTAGTNDVLVGSNTTQAAGNLEAAINDKASQCLSPVGGPCFASGITAANPAASATVSTSTVTVTAPVAGAANNFAVAKANDFFGRITFGATVVGGGTNNGAGSSVFPNFLVPTTDTNATNLATSIAANGGSVGVTASATGSSGIVTITALNAGTDGNLIALSKTISNTDLTLQGANLATGAGQASIVAFNHLYSTQGSAGGYCDSNGPTVYWSYQTSTLATKGGVETSPVISADGNKVAYVRRVLPALFFTS